MSLQEKKSKRQKKQKWIEIELLEPITTIDGKVITKLTGNFTEGSGKPPGSGSGG